MAVTSPDDMHRVFSEAFNRGDLDALVDLYEDEAAFLPQPGAPAVVGKGDVREALKAFVGLQDASIAIETKASVETGDLAFNIGRWCLTAVDPEGKPLTLGATTSEVLRRQPDGTWRYVIDNPWGDALVAG
jgi:ketosteroid isomerase-like protein